MTSAWAAGLFEGEGSIFHTFQKNGSVRLRMSVEMTQREPVERFAQIVGVGNIVNISREVKINSGGRKPSFRWQTSCDADVRFALSVLWPYLSQFKKDDATRALAARDAYLSERSSDSAAAVHQTAEGGANPTRSLHLLR